MTATTITQARPDSGQDESRQDGSRSGDARRRLHRFATVVVVAVLVLIKLGALVTSTGSGMAFPDWPLANGSLWPPDMRLDGLFEHSHRITGALVGLLTLLLAVATLRVDPRRWVHRLALGSVLLVVVQGAIGGIGVLRDLPFASSIAHGVLAQLFLCVVTLLAFALSPGWQLRVAAPAPIVRTARRFAIVAVAFVFVQLVLGAAGRHMRLSWLVWWHVGMALAVSFAILFASMYASARFASVPAFRRLGAWVATILALQLLLGFVALMVRRIKHPSNIEHLGSATLVSLHVLVGALLFLSAALLLYRCLRNLEPRDEAPAGGAGA
jgi:cytochrome c oxidase assembly protein subunit 15